MTKPATLHLVPRPGLVVRDPASGAALPAEGAVKPRNAHWLRRLRDGDVTERTASPAAATQKTKVKE